jgi:putative peptidoglycan lipid II flippase
MFAIGLSQVLLPRFSRRGKGGLVKELLDGITLCSAVVVPSAVGLIFFGKPILDAVFNHGKFTEADLLATYFVLIGYSVGLLFFSLEKIITNAFYSMEEFKLPVIVSAATLIFNLVVDLILCFPLGLGAPGLALGTSLTSLLNLYLLTLFLSRRLGAPLFKPLLSKSLKYLLYSLPVALIACSGSELYFSVSSFPLKLLVLLGVISASGAVYFFTLYLLKDEVYLGLLRKEV